MPSDAEGTGTEQCPLTDAEPYELSPEVTFCPGCGGSVVPTDTPTMYRCEDSGEVFYVEV